MKRREIIGSLAWIGVGLIFCVGSLPYGFSRMGTVGGGFFPFLAGIFLMTLSSIVLVSALTVKKEGKARNESFFPRPDSWRRLLLALLALFAYVGVLRYTGFLLATFFLMIFLLRFIEPQKWKVVLTASLLSAVGAHLIFSLWLKVQLPRGIWGI